MSKKIKLIISVVLIAGIGISIYFGFFVKSDEEKILERLETFEKAYAAGDLTGCIDCLDAKNRNAYKALGNLGSNIGGSAGLLSFDLGGDTFKSLFSLGVAAQNEQLKFNVKAIKFVDKTHAILLIDLWTSEDVGNAEQINEIELEMVKEDGDWYILDDISL